MKISTYVISVMLGVLLGLWFVGSFVDYRATLNGVPISGYSEDQVVNELLNNDGNIIDSSHFVIGGVELFDASGAWLMNLAMLIVGSIPLIISLSIFGFLKRKSAANKPAQPSGFPLRFKFSAERGVKDNRRKPLIDVI